MQCVVRKKSFSSAEFSGYNHMAVRYPYFGVVGGSTWAPSYSIKTDFLNMGASLLTGV